MKKIISLSKVMLKNSFGAQFNDRKELSKSKKILRLMGFILLYAYLVGITFFISKDSIKSLIEINQASMIIYSSLTGLSIYLFFTLMISIPGILYFSNDTESILPLPLSPREILTAKFFSIYITALLSLSFLYLPMGINYFWQVDRSVIFLIKYLLVGFILPIIPVMISSLVIVVIFSFIPKANNKDLFTYVSSIFLIIVIFAISFTSGLNSDGGGAWIDMMLNSDGPLINSVSSLIPSIPLFAKFITSNNLLSGLGASLLSFVLAYISLLISEKLYFKGLLSSSEVQQSNKKLSKRKSLKQNKVKSPLQSLVFADYRNIFRTPALAINYILVLVIIPISMAIPAIFAVKEIGINELRQGIEFAQFMINSLETKYLLLGTSFISFVISYFISSMSTIASTAFTREGENMLNYRSLPIETIDLVHAKLIVANSISTIPGLLLSFVALFILKFSIPYYLIVFITSIIGANLASLEGLVIDSFYPKLIWEDITQAIKQNFLVTIPIFGSFLIIGIMIFLIIMKPTALMATAIFFNLLVIEVLLYYIIKTKGIEKLNKTVESI